MGFGEYAFRRVLSNIPTLIFTVVAILVLVQLAPGDPALLLAGEHATNVQLEAIRKMYGLDKSLGERLWIQFTKMLVGDFGISYAYNRPVMEVIASRIPATLILAIGSLSTAALIGTVWGALSARKYAKPFDVLSLQVTTIMYSIPVFWSGIVFIQIFALRLPIFPISGMFTIGAELTGVAFVIDVMWHLVMPMVTLGMHWLPLYQRVTRASVIEVMEEDFVMACRAVGFPEQRIFLRHALRNAILPVVTMFGVQVGAVFTGAVLVETVFSWPGLGRLLYDSIFMRDYPLLMGVFFVASVSVLVANMMVDLIYGLLDPRIVYK